jgi:lysophospholipase L1-like esterase
MIFSSKAHPPRWRRALAGAAVLALATLAACGGGTTQLEPFNPSRMFAFGDETSHLTADGRKYGVNVLATGSTTQVDCTSQALWVQSVASVFGFVFAECNPGNSAETRAQMRAVPGAKVADLAAQVEAQAVGGGFREGDLATVLVGANDIVELYEQFPARSAASLIAEAGARGVQLGNQVNRLVALGAKVIIVNVPDISFSPFGRSEDLAFPGEGRPALIAQLVKSMNDQLGVTMLLDGRFVGLVQADLTWQAIGRFPLGFGFSNIAEGICTVPVPACTTATLRVANQETGALADPNSYLWADDTTRLSFGGQVQLGRLAVDRVQRNPF